MPCSKCEARAAAKRSQAAAEQQHDRLQRPRAFTEETPLAKALVDAPGANLSLGAAGGGAFVDLGDGEPPCACR